MEIDTTYSVDIKIGGEMVTVEGDFTKSPLDAFIFSLINSYNSVVSSLTIGSKWTIINESKDEDTNNDFSSEESNIISKFTFSEMIKMLIVYKSGLEISYRKSNDRYSRFKGEFIDKIKSLDEDHKQEEIGNVILLIRK